MKELRFRQIHLDYHTSEKIPGIGSKFNAEEFVSVLKDAAVDSLTVFSRCHHGMIYHETKFPAKHPHLTCNLLADQIEALHKADIRCPIYITVGLDEYMAQRHPEWLEVNIDGRRSGPGMLQPGWHKFCFNTPYIDYCLEQTMEVFDLFGDEVDGVFFDIIHQGQCFCPWCRDGMAADGLDIEDEGHRRRYAKEVLDRYKRRFTDACRGRIKRDDVTIFHNSGHIYPDWRNVLDTYTHLELESLPSGGWGYLHFPMTARYARTLGMDMLGMTGKFHKSWGDFGAFKNEAALDYECFNALANGAKCSVGDQLHPTGQINRATYELVGSVYRRVKGYEPWCVGARGIAEIALFNLEAIGKAEGRVDGAGGGAARMLLEGHYQFDIVDTQADWSGYKVLILPDKVTMTPDLAKQFGDYLRNGGKILASYESGLAKDGSDFIFDELPVEYVGPAKFSPDFVTPGALGEGIADTPHVMYERGMEVKAKPEAKTFGTVSDPYFNREWDHFCSHSHTPDEGPVERPAVVESADGSVIYFSHPIFGLYGRHAARWYKQMALNALKRLLPDPLIQTDAPSTAQITLTRQEDEGRTMVHVLHYIPERRHPGFDVIEDVIPLHNVNVKVRAHAPKQAYLAPSQEPVSVTAEEDYVSFTLPVVNGYAMVVLE